MRTKMSSRRALANAAIVAVFPALIFIASIERNSVQICEQLVDKISIPNEKKGEFRLECYEVANKKQWIAFYSLLFTALCINWPVLRWLDDRQWYREWIAKENKGQVYYTCLLTGREEFSCLHVMNRHLHFSRAYIHCQNQTPLSFNKERGIIYRIASQGICEG